MAVNHQFRQYPFCDIQLHQVLIVCPLHLNLFLLLMMFLLVLLAVFVNIFPFLPLFLLMIHLSLHLHPYRPRREFFASGTPGMMGTPGTSRTPEKFGEFRTPGTAGTLRTPGAPGTPGTPGTPGRLGRPGRRGRPHGGKPDARDVSWGRPGGRQGRRGRPGRRCRSNMSQEEVYCWSGPCSPRIPQTLNLRNIHAPPNLPQASVGSLEAEV